MYDSIGVDISNDAPLMDTDLDSLSAVMFRNQLATSLSKSIPSTIVFNYLGIVAIASEFERSISPVEDETAGEILQDIQDAHSGDQSSKVYHARCHITDRVPHQVYLL